MFSQGEVLPVQWNWMFVIISFVLMTTGSGAAITLMEISIVKRKLEEASYKKWMMMAAISFGVCGLWSMHFIGMMAVSLPVPITINPGYAFLTLLFILLFVFLGFATVVLKIPQKNLIQFLSLERTAKKSLTVKEFAAAMIQPYILQGGTLCAIGILLMHYIGMFAISGAQVNYRIGVVVFSVILAEVVACVALVVLFHFPGGDARKSAAALLGIGACVVHYTGTFAIFFTYNGQSVHQPIPMDQVAAFWAALAMFLSSILKNAAFNDFENGLKNYAKLKMKNESEKLQLMRNMLALINFYSRAGCTTTALEYFLDGDDLRSQFAKIEELRLQKASTPRIVDDVPKRMKEFKDLLNHPVTLEVFKDLAVKSFSQENVTFVAEATYLIKWMKEAPSRKKLSAAANIWKTYLKKDSLKQINISAELFSRAEALFSKEIQESKTDDTHDISQEALQCMSDIHSECVHLLFTNLYGTFTRTPEYSWCQVVLNKLPMPAYESLMVLRESTHERNSSRDSHKKSYDDLNHYSRNSEGGDDIKAASSTTPLETRTNLEVVQVNNQQQV